MSTDTLIRTGEAPFPLTGIDKPCNTWYTVCGDLKSGKTPLIVLHGGPGIAHNYLLPLFDLYTSHAIPVVLYDQIGTGLSTHFPEKMGDGEFWVEELFIAQLNGLIGHLEIREFDILGHSWGGMLGARFATSRPFGLRRLVLADAPASAQLWCAAEDTLRATLPQDVQYVQTKGDTEGTTESPEYKAAYSVYFERFVCTIVPLPDDIVKAFEAISEDPTVLFTMWSNLDFGSNGTLQGWSVIDDLHKVTAPTLVVHGRWDVAQDSVVEPFFKYIPRVRWYTFGESSHFPHYEERERYMQIVGRFLADD